MKDYISTVYKSTGKEKPGGALLAPLVPILILKLKSLTCVSKILSATSWLAEAISLRSVLKQNANVSAGGISGTRDF